MRQACPGEVMTYTCTVNQGADLEWIVEPFISGSTRILFRSIDPTGRSVGCNDVAAVQCTDFNFVATYTNLTNPTTVASGTVADITSTLTFTATARLNGTVVQCRGTTASGFPTTNSTLNVTGVSWPVGVDTNLLSANCNIISVIHTCTSKAKVLWSYTQQKQ